MNDDNKTDIDSQTDPDDLTDAARARRRLEAMPLAGLGNWPTPLEQLARFGAALTERCGRDVEIWAKRDDVQGVALAGNKIRKYNVVLGTALEEGYDTLVTTGAVQSNSARAGAAAAASTGMDCVLLLSGSKPDEASGNLLLDQVLGADVRFAGSVGWKELNSGVDAIVSELNAAGRKALAAPVGCSSPLGSLGFAHAFLELDKQLTELDLEPEAIVHTTTSGGTHAGLLVGRALTNRRIRIIGVDAGGMFRDYGKALASMARQSAELIGLDLDLDPGEIEVLSTQMGPRYGEHTEAGYEAISLLARTEAIITDPIYSGKGVAGLVELATTAAIEGPAVFWQTGGYHALFDPAHGTPLDHAVTATDK